MQNRKLRVGIAGYGTVGKIRHRFAKEHPQLNVVAVCDQTFPEFHECHQEVQCFSSYRQLLEVPLDILFVCLPNYLSPEVTIAGLEKGSHVFCEKPPGRDLKDIVNVMVCEKRYPKQKLMFGFNHRYHHSIQDALRIIKSGSLGKVMNMRGIYGKSKIIRFDSDWRTKRHLAGGGILLDQGIHLVDMMRLFAGEFSEISSFISNDFWKHDVEDDAYALMRTPTGVVAMLHSSATQWRHRFQLDITLTKGAIILSGILSSTKSYGAETMTVVYAEENDEGDPREHMTRYNKDHSWKREIFDFAELVLNDKPVTYGSSGEAFKTMELVYRIYCADSTWKKKYNLTSQISKTMLEEIL
ncbi:MAG: oxidoreductase [Gammaproteobacteria bacterium RIFCSPLOWO2_02_FULL_38_11]|nr:MAG: oxidoreductase [Gammaproteobacteria bacterium RIFCSPLOWO2_02_FULL_38_11]